MGGAPAVMRMRPSCLYLETLTFLGLWRQSLAHVGGSELEVSKEVEDGVNCHW